MADPTNPAAPPLSPEQQQMLGLQPDTSTMGKITNFIGNPLVSGALGAYLGTIGSPRYEGLGHAIATGGLEGLGAFNQARMYQLQAPLQRMKALNEMGTYQKNLSEIPKNQSVTALNQARTVQMGPDPDGANHLLALSKDPSATPQQQQIYGLLAPEVQSGRMKFADAYKAALTGNLDAVRAQLIQAQTQEAGAKTQQTQTMTPLMAQREQAQTQEAGTASQRNVAEAGKAGAEASLVPARAAELAAQTQHLGTEGAPRPVGHYATAEGEYIYAPHDPTADSRGYVRVGAHPSAGTNPAAAAKIYQAELDKARTAYLSAHKPGAIGSVMNYMTGADPNADADKYAQGQAEAAMTKMGESGAAALPPHASTGEGLPPGSKPTGDPDGSWVGPDGKTKFWPK